MSSHRENSTYILLVQLIAKILTDSKAKFIRDRHTPTMKETQGKLTI